MFKERYAMNGVKYFLAPLSLILTFFFHEPPDTSVA